MDYKKVLDAFEDFFKPLDTFNVEKFNQCLRSYIQVLETDNPYNYPVHDWSEMCGVKLKKSIGGITIQLNQTCKISVCYTLKHTVKFQHPDFLYSHSHISTVYSSDYIDVNYYDSYHQHYCTINVDSPESEFDFDELIFNSSITNPNEVLNYIIHKFFQYTMINIGIECPDGIVIVCDNIDSLYTKMRLSL